MKKTILLTVLLFATVQFTVAQNTIAKLKFEEAEELFTNGKYLPTLTKLDEVEKLLNTTNPKIIHLKIVAGFKIIEGIPKTFKDMSIQDVYNIIENIKKNSAKYLIEYENLPDNDEKYREIYKTSEKIKSYPNTYDECKEWARPLLQQEYARIIQLILKVAKNHNDKLKFSFEISPGNYDFVIINGVKYYFEEDLYPSKEGIKEKYYDKRALIVQEDGSILFKGKIVFVTRDKSDANFLIEQIDDLLVLTYY